MSNTFSVIPFAAIQMKIKDDKAIVSLKKNIISSKIDDEVVILSVENEEYYRLNSIASSIWARIEKPITLEELIKSLTDEFDVDYSECSEDVQAYLKELNNMGLIDVS